VGETPSDARNFVIAVLLLGLVPHSVARNLDEAAVVARIRAVGADAAAARAAIRVASSQEVAPGLWPNPELLWTREDFPTGPARESEDALAVSWALDLSGERQARQGLARGRTQASAATARQVESEETTRVVGLLYEVAAAEQALELETQGLAALDRTRELLEVRRVTGHDAGYDEARLGVERELQASAVRVAAEAARQLRQELGARLLDDLEGVGLAVTLRPAAEPAAAGPESRAWELHLERAREETDKARRGAAWGWVPTLTMTAGFRAGGGIDTRYGYVMGLGVEIPLFSRGQDLELEAGSEVRQLEARIQAEKQLATVDARQAEARLRATLAELERLEAAPKEALTRLARMTDAGYRDGLRSVVEVLDVRRTELQLEARKLGLALTARRAEIALRRARGAFASPEAR
jgi:outer membrane protein TolC